MLLSKKEESFYPRCEVCWDEITEMDILEQHDMMLFDLLEDIGDTNKIQLDTVKTLAELWEATLATDELLHLAIKALSKKFDLLADKLGYEFELTPEVKSELIIKKKK